MNKGESSPMQAKGDTQRLYKKTTVYRHNLQKSIMRQYRTFRQSCRAFKHRATSWKDWHKPMQSLPARNLR